MILTRLTIGACLACQTMTPQYLIFITDNLNIAIIFCSDGDVMRRLPQMNQINPWSILSHCLNEEFILYQSMMK